MLPFHKAALQDFLRVNDLINQQLHSDVELVESMGQYIVESGGKRLRPLIVLLSALASGYPNSAKDQTAHVELACIIEFIHTATLLHDDVVDMSGMRRGRKTANAKWGNNPSVLVGDFLYSRAFQMLVKLNQSKIMALFADTTNHIAEGEVQQLINAKNAQLTEDEYYQVIYKKTAILFEAASMGGALVAQATGSQATNEPEVNQQQLTALASYGKHTGMAFQLQDDVLDYAGNSDDLGKNIGDDLAEGKPTLPILFAINNASKFHSDIIVNAIEQADVTQLDKVIAIVRQSGGLDYAKKTASDEAQKAITALQCIDDSSYKTALIHIAEFAISRQV